jgi:hypothetical protein
MLPFQEHKECWFCSNMYVCAQFVSQHGARFSVLLKYKIMFNCLCRTAHGCDDFVEIGGDYTLLCGGCYYIKELVSG